MKWRGLLPRRRELLGALLAFGLVFAMLNAGMWLPAAMLVGILLGLVAAVWL